MPKTRSAKRPSRAPPRVGARRATPEQRGGTTKQRARTYRQRLGAKRAGNTRRLKTLAEKSNVAYITPPRRFKRGRKPKKRVAVEFTLFRARGSVENRFRKSPGGLIAKENARGEYFELQSESPNGFPNSPGVWASNEGLFLGQVKFPGRVKLTTLMRLLNVSLNLVRGGKIFDFRRVYKRWEMKYQIYSRTGDEKPILIGKVNETNRTRRKR